MKGSTTFWNIRVISGSSLLLIRSTRRFNPVREEELFLARKKMFRSAHDWPQGRGHLQANHDKNQTPKLQVVSCRAARQSAHRLDQAQSEPNANGPEDEMQRSHERN